MTLNSYQDIFTPTFPFSPTADERCTSVCFKVKYQLGIYNALSPQYKERGDLLSSDYIFRLLISTQDHSRRELGYSVWFIIITLVVV